MNALGALNPLEVVEGEIQAKVATFLMAKQTLNTLKQNTSIAIRGEAEGLYQTQLALENELSATMVKIQDLKSGAWSFGNVAEISNFAVNMVSHINHVKELQQKAGLQPPTTNAAGTSALISQATSNIPPWIWVTGAFAVLKWLRVL